MGFNKITLLFAEFKGGSYFRKKLHFSVIYSLRTPGNWIIEII